MSWPFCSHFLDRCLFVLVDIGRIVDNHCLLFKVSFHNLIYAITSILVHLYFFYFHILFKDKIICNYFIGNSITYSRDTI
jgi:hypothetical protein